MRLPNGDRAIVDETKVRDYLLSVSHPIGRFKALFFRELGYVEGDWEKLLNELRELGSTGEAHPGQSSEYGQKFEIRGTIEGPSGTRASIVTVWIVLTGEDVPRLVTAYPGGPA